MLFQCYESDDQQYNLLEALLMLYLLTRSLMSKWPLRPYLPRRTPKASSTSSLVSSYYFRAAMKPHTDTRLISPHAKMSAQMPVTPSGKCGKVTTYSRAVVEILWYKTWYTVKAGQLGSCRVVLLTDISKIILSDLMFSSKKWLK